MDLPEQRLLAFADFADLLASDYRKSNFRTMVERGEFGRLDEAGG